ncbi:hypothetical protein BPTFM16_01251 [Altererythrobacter insulae]|nr:hypothetical protein BPTFM16_01251 [Altererythrobacter insulae]
MASALVSASAGCAPQTLVTDDASELPRIVSLNPCLDAILVEVAEPEQILALSHYSADPAASSISRDVARRYDVTGGTVEEVIALEPDIVVASTFMAPATRAAFDELGVRVESFGSPTTVEGSITQVAQLAELAGRADAGLKLAETIAGSMAGSDGDTAKSAVLWQPGGIVPGETQLVSELLRKAGFTSHSQALGLGQADYLSLEQVLAEPPDVLLVAGNSRAQAHPALAASGTVIAQFDPSLIYCGGPTIPRAMTRLREIREGLS